jgi:2-methylcitrate dehydratase PrpD
LLDLLARPKAFEGNDADRARLVDCGLDFVAAVLTGVRSGLGQPICRRFADAGKRGYAFTLSYLAEISEFTHGHNWSAGHVGSTTLPTALALAGDETINPGALTPALFVGYEAFARIGSALMPALERWGSVSTGFVGSLGAAATAARARDMDAERICSCLGIASSITPLSPSDAYLSGANSVEAAHATTVGITAAELTEFGIRGAPHILDDLHRRIVGDAPSAAFAHRSSEELAIHHAYFKPYPCCRFAHGAIQAVLELSGQGVQASQVGRLELAVTPRAARTCGFVPSGLHAPYVARQYSLGYLSALALVRGEVTAMDVLNPAPDVERSALDFATDYVVVTADDGLERYGNICPTIVRAQLTTGDTVERRVLVPWGCPESPMTRGDLLEKFRRAALPNLSPTVCEEWIELIQAMAWTELGRRLRRYLMHEGA